MRLLIDVEDRNGNRLGAGPITSATGWRQVRRLDRLGEFSFTMPATDPQAALVQPRRVVRARRGAREVGAGVVDRIELTESASGPMLAVSGMDLGQELTWATVGYLDLSQKGWVPAVEVNSVEIDFWGKAVPDSFIWHPEAFDNNVGTYFSYACHSQYGPRFLYIGGSQPFTEIPFNIRSASGGWAGIWCQYFNGANWVDFNLVSDGTAVDGVTLQQTGTMYLPPLPDWQTSVQNGKAGYYIRLMPAVLTGTLINEVWVEARVPTPSALSLIAARFPAGWSLDTTNGYPSTLKTDVYGLLDGENVVEALNRLAELTGEHWYVGTGRTVVWVRQDTPPSGIRATNLAQPLAAEQAPEVCLIESIRETRESYDKLTRVHPYGAGLGAGRLTLEHSTKAPPAGYVVDKVNNYVKKVPEDDTLSVARSVPFKDVGPVTTDEVARRNAANQLLDAAVVYLARRSLDAYSYELQVAQLAGVIWPGRTVRVAYRRMVGGYLARDLDDDLIALETTTEITTAGEETTRLVLSTVDAWPVSDQELLARLVRQGEVLGRYPQQVEVGQVNSRSFETAARPLTVGGGGLSLYGGFDATNGAPSQPGSIPDPHDLLGSHHRVTGLTVGTYLRADAATHALFDTIKEADVPSAIARVSYVDTSIANHAALPDVHHARLHSIVGGDHTASGLTTGHYLRATGPSSFAFASAPQVTAGNGLTGGGALNADVTLAVGAGDGLTVSADAISLTTPGTLSASSANVAAGNHTHAITASSNPGAASAILKTDTAGLLQLAGLGVGVAPGYPLHVAGATEQIRVEYDADHRLSLMVDATATTLAPTHNLHLAPGGDVTLDPAGNDILPASNYDLNLGALNRKYLTLHAAELWVETLVAQNTLATLGGRILVGPTTTLTADLAAGDTTIYVKHNNLSNEDIVYLEANGQVEFMAVTSGPGGTGPYSYTVTRNLDGSGANQWYAGDAVFNTGQAGNGFIDLYSVRGVKSASQAGPSIVGNVRTGVGYADWTEHWAIGNLNGLYGYGTNVYGAAFGRYAANQPWLAVDATNGIRIMRGVPGTQLARWATDGSILIGQQAAGQSNLLLSAGAVRLRNNTMDVITLLASPNAAGQIATFDGVLGISTSGGIYQGTGTFASPTTGLKVYNSGGIGLLAGYYQGNRIWGTNADGTITFGSSWGSLDGSGVRIVPDTTNPANDIKGIRWETDESVVKARMHMQDAGGIHSLNVKALPVTSRAGRVCVSAAAPDGYPAMVVLATQVGSYGVAEVGWTMGSDGKAVLGIAGSTLLTGGLNVGTATGAATGIVRGSTAAGHNQWAIETTYPGAVAGIQLIANSYTWEWQHRGTFDAPNNGLILFGGGSQRLAITTTGNVLIGTTTSVGSGKLQVEGDIGIPNRSALVLNKNTGNNTYVRCWDSIIEFYIGDTRRGYIDATGWHNG